MQRGFTTAASTDLALSMRRPRSLPLVAGPPTAQNSALQPHHRHPFQSPRMVRRSQSPRRLTQPCRLLLSTSMSITTSTTASVATWRSLSCRLAGPRHFSFQELELRRPPQRARATPQCALRQVILAHMQTTEYAIICFAAATITTVVARHCHSTMALLCGTGRWRRSSRGGRTQKEHGLCG